MSEFNKDDYLNDLPDADELHDSAAAGGPSASATSEAGTADQGDAKSEKTGDEAAKNGGPSAPLRSAQDDRGRDGEAVQGDRGRDGEAAQDDKGRDGEAAQAGEQATGSADEAAQDGKSGDGDTLTPLGQAKKEAADYLEALQRERAEFINYRNRAIKDQERFRQHGIIDVLTALLPAMDDLDRIREHGQLDDATAAVAAKIDKAFEKFGVEKFGAKGEEFDPTKHEAILHKPDGSVDKETVDVVVEAGYRIGDRVVRAARVVVASPQA